MKNTEAGFTLTELLVVMLIAGGIVSVTLHLASTLLSANQRHMSRNRVHADLKRSLDYMAEDLRQALYVYDGGCLGQGRRPIEGGGCPGLAYHLPVTLGPESDRYPVLAFWRQTPLSATVLQHCRQGRLTAAECQSQHAYSLVVYLVSGLDDGDIWAGEARLLRYTLTKFRQSGAVVPGYVDPSRHRFWSWPWSYNGATLANQQAGRPSLRGSAPVPLVDFIDFSAQGGRVCPEGYQPTATAPVLAQVDSVLGCVGAGQDVILSLRGQLPASGRSGQPSDNPTLRTQVFPQPRLDFLPPD